MYYDLGRVSGYTVTVPPFEAAHEAEKAGFPQCDKCENG
jgi:hypothetical protein